MLDTKAEIIHGRLSHSSSAVMATLVRQGNDL